MTAAVLPGLPFRRETSHAARYPFVWRARDLSLNAASEQTGTLVRATTGAALDSASASLTVVHSRPRWQYTSSGIALRMGEAAGAGTEYLKWDLPMLPTAMSGLFDFVENGTVDNAGAGGASLGAIAASGGGDPRIYWALNSAARYVVVHDPTGTSPVSSTPIVTPVVGDRVRFRWWLYSDGSVQAWTSINGGTEVAGTQSAAKTLAANWGTSPGLWLNTLAVSFTYGANLFLGVSIMLGNQTAAKLAEPLR